MEPGKILQYALPIEGMESEHCALIVDRGLGKVPGVDTHRVELNNHRAIITTRDPETVPRVIDALHDLGYGVPTVKQTLPVLEMTCAACAVSVEKMVKAQPGVLQAAVNYASASLSVEYLPNMVRTEGIQQALQAIGYDIFIEQQTGATDTLEDIHRKKFRRLQRRTLWAAVVTLPLMLISMVWMDMPYANFIMWALATPVVMVMGRDFFIHAWKQARHRSANMDTLVALGTGVAYTFSVFNTLFPEFWHRRGIHAHVYFESAAVIITFILVGKLLEEKAKGSTSSAIQKLMGLQAKTVLRLRDGKEETVAIEQVAQGDVLLVRPGEKIAVDGLVVGGSSYVDESMLSGEPVAVLKAAGAQVFAGTLNQKGSFQFRAEKVGSETMLAQIIRMVQEAQGSKAPVQKLVDKIAAIFVPVVMAVAVVALVAWVAFGGENGFSQGLIAMATVLVIACPCALGLATPTAIMVGMGKGAEQGILIKDAASLELTRRIQAVVLDKTGTITEGRPTVTNANWVEKGAVEKAILLAMEKQSEHPLAAAVVEYLQGIEPEQIEAFESITGRGARANAGGKTYLVGNQQLLQDHGIHIEPHLQVVADNWSSSAKTIVWFADENSALGILAIEDNVKESSKEAVQRLQAEGIEVYMLTGDNAATAQAIATATGIKEFRAELLPQDKAAFVQELQAQGKVVAMVGDGINDSTALAQADVSIAMGRGSDIAMDVAKMTIISSDLTKVPEAIQLSRQTVRTIRQNLFWALIYNTIGIPVAAGALYPFTGFLLDPMIAGAAMALSSVSVVGNSLRSKLQGAR